MTQPSDPANPSNSERTIFPLSGVTRAVGRMLDERTGGKLFWVRAEISQCSFSGKHAYIDLVEEEGGQRKAQVRGTIWGSTLAQIRKDLGEEFQEVLKPGREIVFSAHMAFHAVYGFSLNIQRIDLDALLGEMERRRKETLLALQKEGAIGRNGRLPLSEVPQRVVLIGSAGTAGHTDFLSHVQNNAWGYVLDIACIDAPVQGALAVERLVAALHLAGRVAMRTPLDAVVLLRGGGAKLDLDVFNDLTLCRTIAAMEVPVITGIGHETDQTLADAVAHTAQKTPTAVADFLVERMAQFEGEVGREGRAVTAECRAQLSEQDGALRSFRALLGERPLAFVRQQRGDLYSGANGVVRRTRSALSEQHARLAQFRSGLHVGAKQLPERSGEWLAEVEAGIHRESHRHLKQQEERIGLMKNTLALLGPGATLKRGFSITRHGGKALKDAGELTVGDVVETQLESGTFTARVEEIRPPEDPET